MEPDMRQLVKDIQKKRHLSLAELADMLGYKSQTSIARIMQDKANMESIARFAQLMKESKALALTDEERDKVDQALEYKRLGPVRFSAALILRQLLQEDVPLVDPVLVDPQTGRRQSLLSRYLPMKGLKITVVNCETMALFSALAVLTRQNRAKVEHYLYSDRSLMRTMLAVRAVLPILHDPNYFGGLTFASREYLLENPRGILLSDVMVCEYEKDNIPWYDLVVFHSKAEGMRFSFLGNGEPIHSMLERMKCQAQPLRNPDVLGPRGDYTSFLRSCADAERDRVVCRIKPDFGFEQVPVDIWRQAFLDGPAMAAGNVGDLEELTGICLARQQNAFTKPKHQYHVFKRQAVWKFLQTGRLSDQFWAFRTLTMAERLRTLETILELAETNPYFHLYFLRDDTQFRNDEILLLDGLALCIIKPGTDYDLNAGHSEAIITQPEVIQTHRDFFMNSVLTYHVLPNRETLALMQDMISYCRERLN